MNPDHPFDRLSARAILLASVLGMAPGLVLLWILRDDFETARSLAGIVLYAGVALALVVLARARGVSLARLFGRALGGREALLSAGLGLVVLVFSFGTMIALLGGLSLLFPAILERYADSPMDFVVRRGGRLDVVASASLALAAAVAAPFVEELVFRGFLFTRWARRFGVRAGVLWTALLFGLLHFALAPIGAFALGVLAALLYLRTRSLAAPLIAHATANSTIVLATVFGDGAAASSPGTPGVEELRGLLGLGLGLSLVAGAVLAFVFARGWPAPSATVPYDDGAPAGAAAS